MWTIHTIDFDPANLESATKIKAAATQLFCDPFKVLRVQVYFWGSRYFDAFDCGGNARLRAFAKCRQVLISVNDWT